ncbi:MAG: hypothetical protein VX277_04410 [Candidatus Thermoplasmatota archaeon]|nr:hypothetical protein [Candidatus Thermoplasmatota archaeon]
MKNNSIIRFGRVLLSFRICSFCHSIRVYPYMGFMTGPQYQCQECGEISPVVIEFENEEDYNAFLLEEE